MATPMATDQAAMRTVSAQTRQDLLTGWADRQPQPNRGSSITTATSGAVGLRFAFYGRMSTEDFQDEASSRCWQRQAAGELVAGYGRIVADYFDVGQSRRVAWTDRPRAAALLAALADADRGFDAVVVGEYERAFCGDQLRELATVLDQHAAQLWLPELGGAFDRRCPTHQALVMLLGAQSTREIQRSRFRTMAAMQAHSADYSGRRARSVVSADDLFQGSAPVQSAEDLAADGVFDDDEVEEFLAARSKPSRTTSPH